MFELKITDLHEAPAVALGWADKTVSLVDTSGIANPSFGPGHKLFIFDDLHSEKEQCHRPGMVHAPTMKDIKQVLEFTSTFEDGEKVLVHCHGGIARSTAVGILMLIQHGMTIENAVKHVKDVRPCLWPNELIIRLGDMALSLNGALILFMDGWFKKHLNDVNFD